MLINKAMKDNNNYNPSAETIKYQAEAIKEFFETYGFENAIENLDDMNRAFLTDTYRRKHYDRKSIAQENCNKAHFVKGLTILLFKLQKTAICIADTN